MEGLSTSRRLDLAERAVVLVAYAANVAVLWPALRDGPALGDLLVLEANTLVAVFVLARRRPAEISVQVRDWVVAVTGTLAPLLAGPATGAGPVPGTVATTLALVGIVLSLLAKVTLRRNFSVVPARAGIVRGGVYALVRHPMYGGYVITHLGVLAYGPTVRNVLCYLVCWVCLWVRMDREERLLAHDAEYREYLARVRYRLVPGLV